VARTRLTPDLDSVIEFEAAGLFLPVRERRKGGGRRQRLRRIAGETTQDQVWQIRHATFTVGEGEAVAIVGYPESGRDYLLRMAAGTLIADEGVVRRRVPVVGMIGVARALNRNYTVRQNVHLVCGLLGMTQEEVIPKVPEIVAFAELEKQTDKYLGSTPLGVRIKLSWAISMATQARAFAVSQVLAVGDPITREDCWREVERRKADGVSFLVTSDRPSDLLRFCDRAILVDKDEVVGEMPVEEALTRLKTFKRPKAVKQFVDDESSDDADDEFL
jgi:ABC-2 type transport system ATP-binding protein